MQMTCCTYEYDNFPASILVVLNVITLPKRFFFVVVLASLDEEVCEQGEAAPSQAASAYGVSQQRLDTRRCDCL